MILLRLISWPYLRRHAVRSLLTLASVVLGVALYVGIHTANRAVVTGFSQTIDRIGGATQLQVTSGEAGLPAWVLGKVRAVPGVRIAVPVIEAAVDTGREREGQLLVRGVDMSSDRTLRAYGFEGVDEIRIDDPLMFLAQPDSLIVTSEFAARNGLTLGATLALTGMDGPARFVVRGIMKSGGLTQAFGGSLAIMDINAAQQVFGRGRSFDRIDVALDRGVSLDAGRAALVAALGPGLEVSPPSSRGRRLDALLVAYKLTIGVSSVFALFIGLFIIYNAFAIAVTQRRSEIGILRALGATRGQVRTLFLTEGAVVGLLGSAAGLAVGVVLARFMTASISSMLEGVYGLTRQTGAGLSADPRVLGLAIVLGTLTSVLAAWIPARSAARVDPVHALQKGGTQVLAAGESRARRWCALGAAVPSGLLFLGGGARPAFYLGYVLAIVAVLLLTPTLTLWITRVLRPFLSWLRPVEGALAADSLLQAPRRTSATVAAVMLSLALVVGLGGLARAGYESITGWVSEALNADLLVTGSRNLAGRTFRFPASMGEELAAIPGVARVQRVRSTRINYRNTPVRLVSLELDKVARGARRHPLAGNPERMYALASRGDGVIVSENFAQLQRMRLGDRLKLGTPAGMLVLPIVGIIVDWSDPLGTIFVDRRVYVRYWQDDTVNVFNAYLSPGAEERTVRERVIAKYAGKRRIFVLTNHEVRDYVLRLTDQWLGLTYVQLAVAVLVAILGVVNTLTVSILDRRRELGVLRAVGAFAGQVRRAIWIEALTIAAVGVVLGVALGAINLHYLLGVTKLDISGVSLDYQFPWALATLIVPTMLGAALVAALGPGESAVRGSLVEALEYE
jgi:putative ABC transport system permease protein